MYNLFLGISLLFLVMLVVGLVKPSVLKLESRKRVAQVCGSAVVVFFVLFGITSPNKPATTAPAPVEAAATFDVPSLLGKNIDEVGKTLGTANKDDSEPTALQLQMGTHQWDKTWEKDGKDLLVTYNPTTHTVVDFFISADNDSGITTDTKHLLALGNLNENDPAYQVEFVKALKGGGYTGVKVTAK